MFQQISNAELLIMGCIISFLLMTFIHFLFIVPKIAPHRNEATKALHNMLAAIMGLNLLTFFLWLIPAIVTGENAEIYSIAQEWPLWSRMVAYVDMIALPISMLLGHVVTTGKLPSRRLVIMLLVPYALAMIVDLIFQTTWIAPVMGLYSMVSSLLQYLWYCRCAKIYQYVLLNNCSNIDGRQMKWYVKATLPIFILAMLYYPMCVAPESNVPSIIYDLLVLVILVYLTIQVMLNHMDDKMVDLLEEIDFEKSKINAPVIIQTPAEEPKATEEPKPTEAPASQEAEASKVAEPAAETEAAPKPEEPKVWTREQHETFDFKDQMAKLEKEEFFLDPDVSIDWLADKLGTNRHYVSNYLNQLRGVTFYEYVNKLRLSYAENLLRTSSDKASSIGYLSGFNSESTFRRLFKEQFGCTPTQYIKHAA